MIHCRKFDDENFYVHLAGSVFVVKQALIFAWSWFSCHHAFDEQYGR